eukprot:TRINITY_DN4912_c0_g1_i3.p1 TRINITY_DN4912_c0_g1~~TRINITY_DN4912_c0_g1_i3.p1  ORF type:complete len:228 (+),score=36.35 TRINITY_DN4912_c0_g1_i3:287-970(+)
MEVMEQSLFTLGNPTVAFDNVGLGRQYGVELEHRRRAASYPSLCSRTDASMERVAAGQHMSACLLSSARSCTHAWSGRGSGGAGAAASKREDGLPAWAFPMPRDTNRIGGAAANRDSATSDSFGDQSERNVFSAIMPVSETAEAEGGPEVATGREASKDLDEEEEARGRNDRLTQLADAAFHELRILQFPSWKKVVSVERGGSHLPAAAGGARCALPRGCRLPLGAG